MVTPDGPTQVTQLLVDWKLGDADALDRLIPIVYHELRKLAAAYLRSERLDHTLEPTALLHEAYIRMVDQEMPEWQNRAHFFGVAARLMRQILVDHARTHKASKRGAEIQRISFTDAQAADDPEDRPTVLALDEALIRLADFDERKSRVIEMRAFGGMSVADTALALGVSEPTVKRDMRFAQAWLRRELQLAVFAVALVSKFLLLATDHLIIFSAASL
jgi:RNA polymerase sigma factor (TIGR02999 family)